jgi:hypothetical protein
MGGQNFWQLLNSQGGGREIPNHALEPVLKGAWCLVDITALLVPISTGINSNRGPALNTTQANEIERAMMLALGLRLMALAATGPKRMMVCPCLDAIA